MRHATDADHVIAVSTIVSRHRSIKHASIIGGLWGIGHTFTILLIGGGIILFGWVIPARIGLSMELSVGVMLILLGVLNLTGVLQWITNRLTPASDRSDSKLDRDRGLAEVAQSHSHLSGRFAFIHAHTQNYQPAAPVPAPVSTSWFGRLGLYNTIRPIAVGLVHGLAGSAAVALLVLGAIRNPRWALAYLLVFGVGTIAGMMLITGAIGAPFAYTAARSRLERGLRIASGVISVSFGVFIVYQIGFVSGLFTSHPEWVPR
jgi:hypothetical protein